MKRALKCVAACLGLGAAVWGKAEDAPVALPPFLVEELAKGPPWRYGEAMGYEILSRCDDATTRRVIDAHHQLHVLLAEVLPPQLQLTLSVPRALILYDQELQPAASQEVIAQMLRSSGPPVTIDPVAVPTMRGLRVPASMPRYSFLPNLRLWDRDSMTVFMIVRRSDFDADRLSLTRDYIGYLVRSRMPALPAWFIAGFLSVYDEMKYDGDEITLSPATWISDSQTAALKKDPKTAPPVRPLDEFFAGKTAATDPGATYDARDAWKAQAMMFVRWGLDGGGREQRAAFWKWTERSAVEGTTERLFEECFGFDFAAAQERLTAYLPNAIRRSVHFKPARKTKVAAYTLVNATDGQIARIKGDWERLEIAYVKAIHPGLATKYLEQARRTLRRAYDRDDRDPRLLAILGLCESDAGQPGLAREYLEAAARIGPTRPRASYELARLRFAEASANPGARDNRLSVAQMVEVLQPLFAARSLQPPLPEVYELIAESWSRSASPPTRRHLAVLDEGVKLFPRRAPLAVRAAELNLQHGFREDAETLVSIAARAADDDAMRERVRALQQQLAK